MKGNRKLLVVVLYLMATTAIGIGVLKYRYDTLAGAGLWAAGAAAGIAGFMWGNAKEHAANKPQ